MNKITVLGSLNMDIVIETKRNPKVGETIMGESIHYFVGGKGANQGVAASRVGANVRFLGKLGQDAFGKKITEELAKEKIDLASVTYEMDAATGIASITKLPEDNTIIVVSGANGLVDEAYVLDHKVEIMTSDVLLTQLETPFSAVKKGLEIAKEHSVKTVLNPAPYNRECLDLLDLVDYITPNELEFTDMCEVLEMKVSNQNFDDLMIAWQQAHATRLIVTRGAEGVSFIEEDQVVTLPSMKVDVVDTTGAGDTFNGILATGLSQELDLEEAILLASRGASKSVTKLGAQSGMPKVERLKELAE